MGQVLTSQGNQKSNSVCSSQPFGHLELTPQKYPDGKCGYQHRNPKMMRSSGTGGMRYSNASFESKDFKALDNDDDKKFMDVHGI